MSDLHCPARLVCLRHAEGEDNVGGFLVNAVDSGALTTLGREQARAVAEALRTEKIAAIYASPVTRARQTAHLIGAALGLPVSTVDGLREMELGEWEGAPAFADDGEPTSAAYGINEVYLGWLDGDLARSCPGGETGKQVLARVSAALEEIADEHRGEAAVVVGHGGALALALPVLCAGVTPVPLANAARVLVERDADGWTCHGWGI